MLIVLQKTLSVDIDREILRAKKVYNRGELKRLMPILELFKARKFQACFDLANKLPYNKKKGYSEKEHLPLFFGELYNELDNTFGDISNNTYNHLIVTQVQIMPNIEQPIEN